MPLREPSEPPVVLQGDDQGDRSRSPGVDRRDDRLSVGHGN